MALDAVGLTQLKTLYVLRHAKSDWSDGGLNDHDRPLNKRGLKAAPRMGAYLREKKYRPDLILCSTAKRAAETLDLIKPSLGDVPVRYEQALYLASWDKLLERVRWIDDGASSALLIGHNPGLEELCVILSMRPKSASETERARMVAEKFPTCALAVLTFSVQSWRSVAQAQGRLVDFVRPRDLDEAEQE